MTHLTEIDLYDNFTDEMEEAIVTQLAKKYSIDEDKVRTQLKEDFHLDYINIFIKIETTDDGEIVSLSRN